MGYYIETSSSKGKAMKLIRDYDAKLVMLLPENLSEIPADQALICVVDNGPFEAAGYCFSQGEFKAFNRPTDDRPKTWLLMDKKKVHELTGYKDFRAAGAATSRISYGTKELGEL